VFTSEALSTLLPHSAERKLFLIDLQELTKYSPLTVPGDMFWASDEHWHVWELGLRRKKYGEILTMQ
jgi:hypothetical protein